MTEEKRLIAKLLSQSLREKELLKEKGILEEYARMVDWHFDVKSKGLPKPPPKEPSEAGE